jgi:hypothetical protein
MFGVESRAEFIGDISYSSKLTFHIIGCGDPGQSTYSHAA